MSLISKASKIGFIGAGKMGGAIIKGLVAAGHPGTNIIVSEHSQSTLDSLISKCHITPASNSNSVVDQSDSAIIVAVHPAEFPAVLTEIKEKVNCQKKTIISVAGGLTCDTLDKYLANQRTVRCMPNICAEVNESVSGITWKKDTDEKSIKITEDIFKLVGQTLPIKEELFDAFSGVAGCGIAFIYPIIEALSDGAVFEGIDRETALKLAAQTVAGAGKLAVMTGEHPGRLKDAVCSPGGSTIRGVKTIEEHGVRAAYINAVIASIEASKGMRNIK